MLISVFAILNKQEAKAKNPLSSHYFFASPLNNPANINIYDHPLLIGNYRNQNPGIKNSYVNYNISYSGFVDKVNSGVGISLSNDRQGGGLFQLMSMQIMYSKSFQISHEYTLHTGISIGLSWLSSSISGLKMKTPENIRDYSIYRPTGHTGFVLENKHNRLGFSVSNINAPSFNDYYQVSRMYLGKYVRKFPLSYNHRTREMTSAFMPYIITAYQNPTLAVKYGAQYWKQSWFGGIALTHTSFNIDLASITAGFTFDMIDIAYTYETSLPAIEKFISNSTAHEVTFLYKFQYKKNKKGEVKCPKI